MDTKKDVLLQRGFCEYDIDTNFEHYTGKWNITTITKERVAAARSTIELEPLFRRDSVDNGKFCEPYIGRSFEQFADDNQPFEVAPSMLDPYIARICKAVNEIGVCTCMSCDGWHRVNTGDAHLELYMKDRYSVIWFWLITEYVFGEKWHHEDCIKGRWDSIWEPFDSDYCGKRDMMKCKYNINNAVNTRAVFCKNNNYAIFLEKHKDAFLKIRKLITDDLTEKINSGEITNIEAMRFLKLRRCMCEVFLPAAQPLIKAFRSEFPSVVQENAELFIKAEIAISNFRNDNQQKSRLHRR